MKRYAICDKRPDFLHDVKMRALLDERDCLITEISDGAKFRDQEDDFYEQLVILCENMLDDLPEDFEKGFTPNQLIGYCITRDGREKFAAKKIECLGVINSSSQLLSMLLGIPGDRVDAAVPDSNSESRYSNPDNGNGNDFSHWRQNIHQAPVANTRPAEPVPESNRVSSILELREARTKRETDLLLKKEQEAIAPRKQAVSVTITSTKGGVGKTTIATQLACCIALTSHGRGRFQTCIVDFDIGFGDVLAALDYDLKGPAIGTWISDLRRRVAAGENIKTLAYSETEIKGFLQKREDTGLYALLAPQSHTESLDITSDELESIMRNLRENAGLDFIIYDTGNDLKDTTLLALEQAEYVLLIATQDISCAHCLDMFIRTLESIHFDLSKIRLIINNIMSAKATGISVAELQESFNFPCWAKIKHDPAIIRSSNFGKPIVFSTQHDVTKQLRAVIRHLNEPDQQLRAEEPRQGFWKRLFTRKGES